MMRTLFLAAALLASSAALAAPVDGDQSPQRGPSLGPLFGNDQDTSGSYTDYPMPDIAYTQDFDPAPLARLCSHKSKKWTLSVDDNDDGFTVSCKADKPK